VPDYQPDTDRYTWAKAPRYGEQVVETGPLADLLTGGDALISRASPRPQRLAAPVRPPAPHRPALHFMKAHLAELGRQLGTPHYLPPPPTPSSTAKATASCRPPAAPSATGCDRRAHQPLPDRHPDRLERLAPRQRRPPRPLGT
jgi:hypothetical protein